MALTKQQRRKRIKNRIRSRIHGTAEIPRMSVFRSNKQIYVQIINDDNGETLLSAGSTEKDVKAGDKEKKSEQAKKVGKAIAEKALDKGIKQVVFDRNGYLYHGRIKQLADAARENGLKF
jgi:large subunit ribosomal protein L18